MRVIDWFLSLELVGWYYLSQIGLFFVALFAGLAAWRQLRFSTYFELTKFLQDPTVREYRHRAYRLLRAKTPMDQWLPEDHTAVSGVFSSFDVVGMLAKRSLVSMDFFACFYFNAIVDIRRGHEEFLKIERAKKSDAYWGFMEILYKEAVLYKDGIKQPTLYRRTLWETIKAKVNA